jgi:hypothetical protein
MTFSFPAVEKFSGCVFAVRELTSTEDSTTEITKDPLKAGRYS